VRHFVNVGYTDPAIYQPTQWTEVEDRFKTAQALYDALGLQGLVAVVFTGKDEAEPVACACTSPWKGDLYPTELNVMDSGAPQEVGWEFKGVVTKSGWNKMGLVGRCIDVLTKEIARRQNEASIRLWIHTVEEVNGEYWRRRGFEEVRRHQMPAGHWYSRSGFQLVVMFKDVDLKERPQV
jgi:hypothetical protein